MELLVFGAALVGVGCLYWFVIKPKQAKKAAEKAAKQAAKDAQKAAKQAEPVEVEPSKEG